LGEPIVTGSVLPGGLVVEKVEKLHGDGSARTFYRVFAGGAIYIASQGVNPDEDAAFVRIARHLEARGVRVPHVYGHDVSRGVVVMEDVGDVNLHSLLQGADEAERLDLYRPVLELLARMQVVGGEGFKLETGFADAPYGPKLMVEAEGRYFLREFAAGYLGLAHEVGRRESTLDDELGRLAAEAARYGARRFLHRDFQSRNLHLYGGEWVVIDFQGARPGPPAYDAAALIHDPYAANGEELKGKLTAHYLQAYGELDGVGEEELTALERSMPVLGAFRMMQALGAYAKLGHRLGKPGFIEHAPVALENLSRFLLQLEGDDSGVRPDALGRVTELCRERLEGRRAT